MTTATASTPAIATDPLDIERGYRHYRPRILLWSIIGYAMFYFVRKNLSIAMPVMEQQLGVSKASLGTFLTLHGLIYGLSKFGNGVIGDRVSAPSFMAIGLFCSAIINVFFGLSAAVVTLGVLWMINGYFQGIGFPPCARLLTHWFSPKELATKMAIWNTSHGIGAAAVLVLCGWLVDRYHDWRLCFFVPAGLAIATAGLVLIYLKDTPASVGLPPVPGTGSDDEPVAKPQREVLMHRVFANYYVWLFSLANFFVYVVRYAVFDWGPTMLKESKGVTLSNASWIMAGFEIAGVIGALFAGWITDRHFRGRGARPAVFCMIGCAAAIFMLWRVPSGHLLASTLLLLAAGFFVYAPQALVGIAAANLATKEAAATAVGLTGLFGYASTVVSGFGMGWVVQHYGWDRAFEAMLVAVALGLLVFILAWRAPRDGYGVTREARGFPIEPTTDRRAENPT